MRRSKYQSGKINRNTYKNLEKKVNEFMKITPPKRRGMPTRAKSIMSILKKSTDVK